MAGSEKSKPHLETRVIDKHCYSNIFLKMRKKN